MCMNSELQLTETNIKSIEIVKRINIYEVELINNYNLYEFMNSLPADKFRIYACSNIFTLQAHSLLSLRLHSIL